MRCTLAHAHTGPLTSGVTDLTFRLKNKFGFVESLSVSLGHQSIKTPLVMGHTLTSPLMEAKLQQLFQGLTQDQAHATSCYAQLSCREQQFADMLFEQGDL